jgi:hypothetical protein
LIKARNLSTYVASDCLSACTIIFLSGTERLISPGGKLGFHQPDFPGLTSKERQEILADQEQRLEQLGVSPAFAHKANMATPDDMWYPAISELVAEHVVTRVVNGFDLALSGIDPADIKTENIQNGLLRDPMYASIRRNNPEQYSKIVQAYEEGLKRGASRTELMDSIKPAIVSVFLRMLPYATDGDIIESMHMFIKHASKMKSGNPLDCYNFMKPENVSEDILDGIRKRYPTETAEDGAFKRRVIEHFSDADIHIWDPQEFLQHETRLEAVLRKRYGSDADLPRRDTIPPDKRAVFCSVAIAYYEEVLKWPAKDAVGFYRYTKIHP